MSSASVSRRWRPPRPCPWRRRASSPAISLGATGTAAGMPSRTAPSALPWDSPAVSILSTAASYRTPSRGSESAGAARTPPPRPATAPPVGGSPGLFLRGDAEGEPLVAEEECGAVPSHRSQLESAVRELLPDDHVVDGAVDLDLNVGRAVPLEDVEQDDGGSADVLARA